MNELLKDNSERILAIDYGEKRIGLAITDPLKMFAIPLTTINNDKNFWDSFKKVFKEYMITFIVIGYPLSEDGEKTEITSLVEKFSRELLKRYKIEFEFVDERYSSAIAWEHIVKGVSSKKKRRNKALIDMNAAAVILEDYLKMV
jgi:putative Holliday junction resolvase